jgi:hypothetical protein
MVMFSITNAKSRFEQSTTRQQLNSAGKIAEWMKCLLASYLGHNVYQKLAVLSTSDKHLI